MFCFSFSFSCPYLHSLVLHFPVCISMFLVLLYHPNNGCHLFAFLLVFQDNLATHTTSPYQPAVLQPSSVPSPQVSLLQALPRVLTVIQNLEKSWKFKMLIPGPGKVMENNIFNKVMESCIKYNLYFI